jgi:hypothetical protein
MSDNLSLFIILFIFCGLRMATGLPFYYPNSVWPGRAFTSARCSETSPHPPPPRALPDECFPGSAHPPHEDSQILECTKGCFGC